MIIRCNKCFYNGPPQELTEAESTYGFTEVCPQCQSTDYEVYLVPELPKTNRNIEYKVILPVLVDGKPSGVLFGSGTLNIVIPAADKQEAEKRLCEYVKQNIQVSIESITSL